MGWAYDALVTELNYRYGVADANRGYLNTNRSQANFHWSAGEDHEAIYDIIEGMSDTVVAFGGLLAAGFHSYGGATYTLIDALSRERACPFIDEAPPYELTMSAIINTMLTANPMELEYFVGIVDAYRQSIWNKPFNSELFAALARGFEEWP